MATVVKIQVNGEQQEIAANSSIADLLAQLEVDPRYLAVERNLELVPRAEHAATKLAEGDRVEVVTLVGGG